jgi:hypothetical protein
MGRGNERMKSLIKGYGREKRLGYTDLDKLPFLIRDHKAVNYKIVRYNANTTET